MRRSLGVCVVLAVLLGLLLTAGTGTAAAVRTSQGDKAMVFMFSGLDDLGLGGFPGDYGVGLRYYFADHRAIRAGVTFGNCSFTDKAIEEEEEDLKDTDSTWGIDLSYEQHLEAPCASVSPYLGANLGYYSWKADTENLDTARDVPVLSEEESGLRVGALAGFEWGFTDCMTLGGEYILGYMSGSYKAEYTSGDTTITTDEEEWSCMGFATASVYLSVYW